MSQRPQDFGKYLLLEQIATGGMAEVFLAKTQGAENVHKFFALKRILPQHSKNIEFIEMFKEEAKIAVQLTHSNIVTIFEFGEINEVFYLVMEYVEGRNLRQILNKLKKANQVFSIDQILYVINEASRGLDHAHRAIDSSTGRPLNITHRDMSPQNVMISFEGEVKILDFGIAKAESKIEATRAGTLKGKFGYMSPEQADGQNVDFRTDIFSLGIILWELLANDRLFVANNEVNTLRKIRNCQIPGLRKINPNIPEELERIANKALARDRNLRYQSTAEMQRDLGRLLNRQFPDFSAQDFSAFMKTLFADEILDSRRKLVDYAKIKVQRRMDEKTNTDVTEDPDNVAISRMDFRQAFDGKTKTTGASASGKVSGAKTIDFGNIRTAKSLKTMQTGNRSKSFSSSGPKQINFDGKRGSYGFIALLLLAAGVFLSRSQWMPYVDQLKDAPTKKHQKVFVEELPNVEPTAADFASVPDEFSLFITSSPAGAEIYIDNRQLNEITPATVKVPAGKVFNIRLRKENFLPYSVAHVVNQDGQKYSATLQMAKLGYLNIEVFPPLAEVFVNGTKLEEQNPIVKYAVPVSGQVKVRAYNPVSKAEDEQIVSVKQDLVTTVRLYPKTKTKSNQP